MRAAIYARVSSDPRGVGRSVSEQEADCRAIAEREGWEVVHVFTDNDRGASRYSNGERKAYADLVSFLEDGRADVLITWEASRAQRDLDAYVRLRDLCRDRGVQWSYSGRTYDLSRTDDVFQTGLDALLAEREAGVTSDRIKRAVRANAAKGRPHGKLNYGYTRLYDKQTGELVEQVVNEEQAAVIREAAARVLGGETPYAVAKDYNERGIPTPRNGKGWDLSQIKRMVTNPAYIAKRVHQGKVVGDADWPPILDEATFYALEAKLNDPRRRTQRDSSVKHLLSGIAVCGVCGGRVRVQKNRGFLAYLCVDGFHVSRKEEVLDEYVTEHVLERLSRPDALATLSKDDDQGEAAEARKEAEELRARLETFYDQAAEGDLTAAALARIEGKLLPRIEAAERRAQPQGMPQAVRDLAGKDVRERWAKLSMPVKREVVRALVDVRILRAGRGARTFRPETVAIEWK